MQLLPDPPVTTSSERSVVEGALEDIKYDPNTLSQCPLQCLAPEEDPGHGSNSSARPTSIDSCRSDYKTRVLSDKCVFLSVRAVMGDLHQDQVYRLCVEQLGGIYISGLSFGENLNGVLGHILKSADIFITPHRDNQEYIQATQCNLTIGTPAWITHISSTGAWSAPEEHLLHYPYPKEPARGFEDQMVTTTRYSGKAREYVKKMVVALGGRYTPHLTDMTTCVIAAHLTRTSYQLETGQDKIPVAQWHQIPVVNPLWLEDCFREWAKVPVNDQKYLDFPDDHDWRGQSAKKDRANSI
ncbi:unnamed protein product [Rhizoctonia solani]|uniref:BRCT domain-containing protein n=1 Tax=Rhizoctonia solani TaxID=456999 RepID=A0A8H3DK80_9AGAM|nr:unnamed protein product [Rhizoctonia solani]CAE6529320.1 unnamed protein product [Rhizoctonia solani]